MKDGINGYLMNSDKIVAKICDDIVNVIDGEVYPLFFMRCNNIVPWLENRAIDEHRTHSRLLKRILRLKEKDDVSTVMSVHAATLTDTYWIKLENEKISYDDIKFERNDFSDLALSGDLANYGVDQSTLDFHTPELTTIGSFEKCWRYEDGCWWMYKTGKLDEHFSELFIERLGNYLNFPMAVYEFKNGYIKTKDFTDGCKIIFEPIEYLIGDRYDDYKMNYDILSKISKDLGKQYLDILYLDAICRNPDRHEFNYGLLRDPSSGKIISLAPNYDNNTALISLGKPKKTDRDHDFLIQEFCLLLKELELEYKPRTFDNNVLDEILNALPIKNSYSDLKEFLLNGQEVFFKIHHKDCLSFKKNLSLKAEEINEVIDEIYKKETTDIVEKRLDSNNCTSQKDKTI